jgi:hypothetical protein
VMVDTAAAAHAAARDDYCTCLDLIDHHGLLAGTGLMKIRQVRQIGVRAEQVNAV